MRNLQEQVKKAFCYQKLFRPSTVRINCSSDLKIFENSRPSASNFNFFFWSLEQFFLTVCQNNFGNKIPFLFTETNGFGWAKGRQRDLLRILPGFKLSNEPKSGFAVIRIYALPSFTPIHHGAKFFMITKRCFVKLLKWVHPIIFVSNVFHNSHLNQNRIQNQRP